MTRKIMLACLVVVAFCAGALPALAMPIVELKAVGPYSDPHDITVAPETKVRLVYTISSATNLTDFQNRFTVTGSTTEVKVVFSDTWWGTRPTATGSNGPTAHEGMYTVLGITLTSPYSYSTDSEASLAFIDVTPLSGTVVVDLLSPWHPNKKYKWESCDPVDGYPVYPMDVDLVNSLPVVTIHTGVEPIPEPASALLLAVGLGAALSRRRRRG